MRKLALAVCLTAIAAVAQAEGASEVYTADGVKLPAGPYEVAQELGVHYWPEADASIPKVKDDKTGEQRPRFRRILNVFSPKGVKGPLPGIFLIHGGGFGEGDPDSFHHKSKQLGPWLASHGYVAFSLGYTLGGGRLAATIDGRQAIRFVKINAERFGVAPDRLGAWGFSAGGMLMSQLLKVPDGGEMSVEVKGADGKASRVRKLADGGTLRDKATSDLRVMVFSSGHEASDKDISSDGGKQKLLKAVFAYQGDGERPWVKGEYPRDNSRAGLIRTAYEKRGIAFQGHGVVKGGHCPRIGLPITQGGRQVLLRDAIFAFLEAHLKGNGQEADR